MKKEFMVGNKKYVPLDVIYYYPFTGRSSMMRPWVKYVKNDGNWEYSVKFFASLRATRKELSII
jgi:hypothetical protein